MPTDSKVVDGYKTGRLTSSEAVVRLLHAVSPDNSSEFFEGVPNDLIDAIESFIKGYHPSRRSIGYPSPSEWQIELVRQQLRLRGSL